ncbi:hypothetical protein MDA_GLEAN10005919 [Myotis davidii]|uniref:SWIM-type domain-containing protein n=1 Tax=Myotis davidii TaxID=225400 RepID=L5LIN4_MYODS|nr:hypothetical protein MDA_GLEAN10005919 [Myotis davidii]
MERPRGLVVGQEEQEEQELLERAFFSWAEFSRFFDAWCQQRLALFFIQSSMHLTRCHWARLPPLYTLIDVLKYSYVRLVCKDVRAPSRPAMGHHEAGCPAFIIVKLSPLRDRLVVTECRLTHSHPACPIEFAYYFRPGRLLANTCLPVRTTNKISKQFLVLADVHRLLSYCKDRDHSVIDALRVLQGLFHKDPEAKEVDWEPLAKFRAACGPELADLVAEELSFARQHGTRGFHVAGAGFALKDGTSDFFLDGALTRCSCSIHAARHLPCRHLFAARLLTGAALFHVDLLRDCWGRAPES